MVNLSKQIKEYIDFCECMKGVSVKTKAAYQTDLKQFKSWHGNDYDWCNKPVYVSIIQIAYLFNTIIIYQRISPPFITLNFCLAF